MTKKPDANKPQLVGFLGVGLDSRDGDQRISRSDNFVLIGGSRETHERMQDTAIHFDEALEKKGKQLQDATPEEVIVLLRDAIR